MVQAKAGRSLATEPTRITTIKKYRLAHFTFHCPQVSSSAFGIPGKFDSV